MFFLHSISATMSIHSPTTLFMNSSNSQLTSHEAASSSGTASGSFHTFFEFWTAEQSRFLKELSAAAAESNSLPESEIRSLVARVIRHYEQYYQAKSRSAQHDVLSVLTPPWRTLLEDAFLWIGGWRPSMAFHLLYSESGLQFEARLDELLSGLSTGDLGDLSPSQLARVDELQRETLREEKAITEAMAEQQEKVVDSSIVQLSHAVTELMRSGGAESAEERVDSALAPKEEALREILRKADDLRLRTLWKVIDLLTPIQAVYFLIAAAELQIRIHEWGVRRDAMGPTQAHNDGLARVPAHEGPNNACQESLG